MRKIIGLTLLLLFILTTGVASAAPPAQGGGQAYTVQGEDTLSWLAEKFYQDFNAWPAIQNATNAKAAEDSRFSPIKNPDALELGQLIWIPDRAEVDSWLAGYAPVTPELQPITPELLAAFDTYIEATRQRFQIPGTAVVLVRGNEIIFAKGFGVRELGKEESITPETVFAVASTTKAMNSLLMATLVDEGLFTWDQPVVELWPDFKLSDPEATPNVWVRELLGMSSGVARADLVWSGSGLAAEQIMESLAELPVLTPPGQAYHYNNQAVATMGYIAALRTGGTYGNLRQAYTDLLQARVFDRIGMPSATLSIEAIQTNPNHATPHDFTLAGEVVPTHFHADPGITPAGAVNANALDMARFVMTQLNEGVTPDGERVVSAENLAETWQPQVRVTQTMSYGMGWFIENYRGVRTIWHDGDVLGFKALIGFIPEADVGFVILTNRMISTGFSYSVRYRLIELLYGLEFQAAEPFEKQWDNFIEAITELRAKLQPSVNAAEVAGYLGNYTGNWRVELRGETLWAVRGPYEWQLLKDAGEGEFMINNGFGIATPLKFIQDEAGDVLMTFTLTSGEVGEYYLIKEGE